MTLAKLPDVRKARSVSRWMALLGAGLFGSLQGCNCDDELEGIPGQLVGQICAPSDGQPLSSHPITIETVDEVIETETDVFGKFEVKGITPGPVLVRAEVEGEERLFEAVVEGGLVAEIEDAECRPPPPPPTGRVSGCVCDEERGQWVSGANVYIVPPSGNIVVTGTDEAGCFLLEEVPVGTHTLKIDKGAFYREHEVQVAADEEFRIPTPDTCEPPPPPVGTGTVEGRVCAPDGTTWLSGATVYVELDDGTRIETTTDGEGRYVLEGVPAGEHVVYIEKGSFSTSFVVEVPEGGTVVLDEEECQLEQDVRIAVIDGQWDDVRSVLLNVGIDEASIDDFAGDWAAQLLTSYDQLAQYDILFFNCGLNEFSFVNDVQNGGVMRDNLRQFVEMGGSIYASDQAYDVVEVTFPEFVDFHGDDATRDAAERGWEMQSILGTVWDAQLAAALGANQLELHYPLPFWAVMEAVSDDVRVYIRGDARVSAGLGTQTLSNVPHTVGFQVGQGRVIYTSFHQEPGINQEMERVLQLLVFEL